MKKLSLEMAIGILIGIGLCLNYTKYGSANFWLGMTWGFGLVAAVLIGAMLIFLIPDLPKRGRHGWK
jgi:hypothetical protein